jgi:adenosine deaminase
MRPIKFCTLALSVLQVFLIPSLQFVHAGKQATAEERAARAFEKSRNNPLALRAFLVQMPKGADLHNHLSGSVYAESWIRAGAEDNLCVNQATLSFVKADGMTDSAPPQPVCGFGKVPVSQSYADQHLYDALVDAFSMRGFVATNGNTGHDHFFDTFSKFSGTAPRHLGEWLDEVANRAELQNEQYIELMLTPPAVHTTQIAKEVGWIDDFEQLRDQLLAKGLRSDISGVRDFLDQAESTRNHIEHCGEPEEVAACRVRVKYIFQVARGGSKELVFAQTLLGLEAASADPRIVAINYVQAEDGLSAMANYQLHMKMIGFLRHFYPQTRVSLHAGELAPGLVTPAGLCCHIRLAIEQAHAERIGHGVDVMYEDRPYDLLAKMASERILVEINLTSNDVILGVRGVSHPFMTYRSFDVPVALSTDDEGVSRIDLTHEYVRATQEFGLSYPELKILVRNSIEYSFLPGPSLWSDFHFLRPSEECRGQVIGRAEPSSSCAQLLKSSEKAREEWELEKRFYIFESHF